MKNPIIRAWIITAICFIFIWPVGLIAACVSLYITAKNLIARRSSGDAEELERQREIERKEIDMVRKSNEILLHLIQNEHREEGDR